MGGNPRKKRRGVAGGLVGGMRGWQRRIQGAKVHDKILDFEKAIHSLLKESGAQRSESEGAPGVAKRRRRRGRSESRGVSSRSRDFYRARSASVTSPPGKAKSDEESGNYRRRSKSPCGRIGDGVEMARPRLVPSRAFLDRAGQVYRESEPRRRRNGHEVHRLSESRSP